MTAHQIYVDYTAGELDEGQARDELVKIGHTREEAAKLVKSWDDTE